MSLLTASSIINHINNPFNNNTGPFILMRMVAGNGSRFCAKAGVKENEKIWYDNNYGQVYLDELEAVTLRQPLSSILMHELAHAYHYMVGADFRSSFVNFSILNNPFIDSCDRFFPILSPQALKEILPLINNNGATIDKIKNIVIKAIKYGFWNVLADTLAPSTSQDDLKLDSLMKNDEFVKRCIYLEATVLPTTFLSEDEMKNKIINIIKQGRWDDLAEALASKTSNDLKWNNLMKNGNFTRICNSFSAAVPSNDNLTSKVWGDNEEMLTIQGYIPIWTKDNRLHIIEDRQNEHIFKQRNGEKEKEAFRYQNPNGLTEIFGNLKGNVISEHESHLFRLLKKHYFPQKKLRLTEEEKIKGKQSIEEIFSNMVAPYNM